LEDPVTGSSHTTHYSLLGKKLRKKQMIARQAFSAGRRAALQDRGERVKIGGEAFCT
jgi:predicted PhzF superfamily epimerase YddE/YHI9